MKLRILLLTACCSLITGTAIASGYGVFTQGASGLGQANAVVAHSTGPSSVYFNPALINDIPGTQIEVGTTAVYADRKIKLDSGRISDGDSEWNSPSTFYMTHEFNDKLTVGLGVFFPFGLSNKWDSNYEGKYIGTEGELFTTNINPAVSWRVNDRLSLAAGASAVYLDTTLKSKVNQTAAYILTDLEFSGGMGGALPPLTSPLNDIEQTVEGDDWGYGFNLGLLVKLTDKISFGAAYRSEINLEIKGADVTLTGVDPILAPAFPSTKGDAGVDLPQQVVAGLVSQHRSLML